MGKQADERTGGTADEWTGGQADKWTGGLADTSELAWKKIDLPPNRKS